MSDKPKKELKNRKPFASTMEKNLYDLFHQLHLKTRIPKSRLIDEAVSDLLKKYDHK